MHHKKYNTHHKIFEYISQDFAHTSQDFAHTPQDIEYTSQDFRIKQCLTRHTRNDIDLTKSRKVVLTVRMLDV